MSARTSRRKVSGSPDPETSCLADAFESANIVCTTLPLLLDLTLALTAAILALTAVTRYSRSSATPHQPSLEAARAAGGAIRPHRRVRALLATRFDREVATGFLFTLALGFALTAGIVLGLLAYLVRAFPALQHLDRSVADWAFRNRSSFSTSGLNAITSLGTAQVVIVLAVVVAAFDFVRTRNRWSAPFLIAVLAGMELITLGVKDLVGRVRPALVPAAAHLGPSFPSGHSATAAAFYAAAALVVGRRLPRRGRQLLAAVAVAVAVAVAASRVLLDLHWLSDVIGGLALGWGWFAFCAVLFGGRLLRPTAALDTAAVSGHLIRTPAPPPAGTVAGGPGSSGSEQGQARSVTRS